MGSSPGFGSAARHQTPCSDSLSLRLRPTSLKLATRSNSPAHSSIGTPSHGQAVLRLLGGARFQALGTPLPGSFPPFPHGTVRYRSPRVARLGGWSPRLPAGFPVSRGTRVQRQRPSAPFAYGALTPSGQPSQAVRLWCTGAAGPRQWPTVLAHNPRAATAAALARHGFGLKPLSLTTTRGLAVASSSSGY